MSDQPPQAGPRTYPDQTAYPMAAPAVPAMQRPGPAPGLAYAGFWIRALGYVLDRILLFAIETPITIPFVYLPIVRYYQAHQPVSGKPPPGLPADLTGRAVLIGLVGVVFTALYFGGLVAWQGRTFGQRATGISVVRAEDGGKLPPGRCFLRAGIFWGTDALGLIPTVATIAWLVALIGLASAAWDQRKQGWHDKLAHSLAIRRVPL